MEVDGIKTIKRGHGGARLVQDASAATITDRDAQNAGILALRPLRWG
jgi:hypothetical protein